MFSEYIMAALARAEYEVINNPEPYYAHVPSLDGVWATGRTFEECRKELIENIEEWIAIRLRHGFSNPPIDGHCIEISTEPMAVGQKITPVSWPELVHRRGDRQSRKTLIKICERRI